MGLFDPEWVVEWNFYCDTYGIDTISFSTGTAFYMEMYEYGILNKERCGGLELVWGNGQSILEFLHRIAKGDKHEFIQIAAKGIRKTKDWLISKGWGDEAWLIFMDMVNKQIPTFKDKAEALHYFPMWRTWFGLVGLCKLPWNDVTPALNAKTAEPAKIPEHVQNYADIMSATLGKDIKPQDLVDSSERVYNYQRAMNVWMGRGTRKDDWIPMRAKGPVTELEYLSRQDRYDKQLIEKELTTKEVLAKMPVCQKLELLASYRNDQYEKLTDAVYHRRGWTPNGIPAPQKMKALGFGEHKDILDMLQKKIDQDETAGLNKWGGNYGKDESPPTSQSRYWEKW